MEINVNVKLVILMKKVLVKNALKIVIVVSILIVVQNVMKALIEMENIVLA